MSEHTDFQADDFARDTDNPLSVALAARDADILATVRDAVDKGRVKLAYQPVVRARDTARAAFYEGLLRVIDSTGRIVPAREFIDAVECTELGRKLDCMSLAMGLKALAEQPDLRLAINMSARSVGYAPWMRTLERGLSGNPTVSERLILEITESSAMAVPELVCAFMADLQSRGICFALDDFGAGHTAFRHLREFYFDIVKIDGQFIRDIDSDPDNQVLTQALISIGQHFEMFTVAEGVETPEQAAFLAASGVDCMQGYCFGAPSLIAPWQQDEALRRAV